MFRIRASYEEGSEVDRLGNEIIILEIVFGIVQSYEWSCKINKEPKKIYKKPPVYQFLKIPIIGIIK